MQSEFSEQVNKIIDENEKFSALGRSEAPKNDKYKKIVQIKMREITTLKFTRLKPCEQTLIFNSCSLD